MKRKITEKLLEWKQNRSASAALLIEGAKGVGKTYAVTAFASSQYRSSIIIDFNKASDDVKNLFNHYLDDLDTLFMYLSVAYGTKLYEHESLIVFDEVQLFPRARAAIKYLVADGRYSYIETGSLISIKRNVQDIVIPSEERHLNMYPMDFEEFLWASGNDTLMDFIRHCYQAHQPMGQLMHRKAMDYFRQYLIIGGMPQAVSAYTDTHDFDQVDLVKRDILTLYRSDIAKYAIGYETKVRSIFDNIPGQLQKREKKFRFSALGEQARFRSYEDAVLWLDDAMIINPCFNTTEPSIGLRMNKDQLTMKCYMADTGLLISQAFDENGLVSEEIYKKLLFGKLELNQGMIIENIVAQMLRASGHALYFYSNTGKEDISSRMEIDFLTAKNKATTRHNISPIEVKSSKNYTLISLNKFIRKYHAQLYTPYVIHVDDYAEKDGIVYLPIYMTPLL